MQTTPLPPRPIRVRVPVCARALQLAVWLARPRQMLGGFRDLNFMFPTRAQKRDVQDVADEAVEQLCTLVCSGTTPLLPGDAQQLLLLALASAGRANGSYVSALGLFERDRCVCACV